MYAFYPCFSCNAQIAIGAQRCPRCGVLFTASHPNQLIDATGNVKIFSPATRWKAVTASFLTPPLAGVLLFLAHAFFPAYGGLFFLFCLFAFVPGVMAIAGISRMPRGAKGICGALYIPASWAAEFFTYVFLSKL